MRLEDEGLIVRLANDAVDEVRRAEVFRAKEREDGDAARALKRTRWALLKSGPHDVPVGSGSAWTVIPPQQSIGGAAEGEADEGAARSSGRKARLTTSPKTTTS